MTSLGVIDQIVAEVIAEIQVHLALEHDQATEALESVFDELEGEESEEEVGE